MYKKIFISKDGVLSLEGDRLSSSYDLLEDLCMGNEPILGQLYLSDGVFCYFDNLGDNESIEDVGLICEYIKIEEIPVGKIRKIDKVKEWIYNNVLVATLAIGIAVLHLFIFMFKLRMIG